MKIEKILYKRSKIEKRVKKLAEDISFDYKGKDLVVIGVLKGAFVFVSDLIRMLSVPAAIDFIRASSYGNSARSSGQVLLERRPRINIAGKDVLIVEDIIDTGKTLKEIVGELSKDSPSSLKICVLLDKKERRRVEVVLDYVGFMVPNVFVAGYGIDWAEKFRNLSDIVVLREENLSTK